MTACYVCFSHGKESGPWGSKIRAMADLARARGHQVDSVDYQGIDDVDARVAKLVEHCRTVALPLVLVGSSMGAYVATAASAQLRPRALFLLAPAFHLPSHGLGAPPPHADSVTIVHGWNDDVVPAENSVRFASAHRCTLHLVDGDHRLKENIDDVNEFLAMVLREVEG